MTGVYFVSAVAIQHELQPLIVDVRKGQEVLFRLNQDQTQYTTGQSASNRILTQCNRGI